MNLAAHYEAMRQAAERRLALGEVALDPLLDSPLDNRRGLTLLARPPAPITSLIEALLADFQNIEPAQYYYPAADIHLTVLSIISCYPGFTLEAIEAEEYQRAVRTLVRHTAPFTVTYAGLTASPAGILVQGFPHGPGLEQLRHATRQFFRQSPLRHSIDQRYRLQTAHATVIRFRQPLANSQRLLEKLLKYQAHFIGSFEVATVELVFNDWYQRAQHTMLLEKYPLTGH